METIHQFLECYSQTRPEKTALIDAAHHRTLSYRALYERVELLATRLNCLITTNDLVVVISRSRLTLVEYILGCARMGARCLPIVEPDAIAPTLISTRQQQLPTVFYAHKEDYRWASQGDTWIPLDTVEAQVPAPLSFTPHSASPFYVNTTGGTTGFPKLVVASQHQVLRNTLFALETFGFHEQDIHLSAFQFHAHDWFVRGICSGGTTVLVKNGVDYPNVMNEILRYTPTALMAGPPLLKYLLHQRQAFPKSLRQIECGGAKLDTDIIAKSQAKFGVTITPVWGSTETTGIVLASDPSILPKGSIGKPIGDYQIKIIDHLGHPVPQGKVGQMVISSTAVADTYLDKHQEYEGLSQGTAHTGDLVKMDAEGFLYIVGRMKNQFKRLGFSLNSEAIETVFNEQPEIEASMVVPLPGFGGFYPLLLVEPSVDETMWNQTFPTLKTRIESRLEHATISFPQKWLIVKAIPRKPSGKLDRQLGYTLVQNKQYIHKLEFSLSWTAYARFLAAQIIHNRRLLKPIAQGLFSLNVVQLVQETWNSKLGAKMKKIRSLVY